MKRSILIILLLNALFSLHFDLVAQQNNDEPEGRVINAEPLHTHYILEEVRAIPIVLNPLDINEIIYNHTFNFISSWKNKQVFVRIDESDTPYSLKINRFNYGSGSGKRIPTEFNITPFLKQGANTIQLDYISSGGGLNDYPAKTGTLIIRDPVHVRDILVNTYSQEESGQTLVRVHLYIQSFLTNRNEGRKLKLTISDPEGKILASEEKSINYPLAFRQEVEFIFDKTIEDLRRWSPSDPVLYSLQINMAEKGRDSEELVSTTFGIRSASVEDSVLVINLDTIVLRTIDYESQLQHFGLPNEEVLKLFEEKGYNAVQTSEPIPARLMELFDREGIVVLKRELDFDSAIEWPVGSRPSVVWIE